MHIEIARDTLVEALGAIESCVERRVTIPILGHMQIAANGAIELQSTNLERWISDTRPGTVVEAGVTTLPALKLRDIARALPAGQMVRIAIEDGRARVSCGRARFVLPILPAEDFPAFRAEEMPIRFELDAADLRALIETTRHAVDAGDRLQYKPLWLHVGSILDNPERRLIATAADGHRMARKAIALPAGAADMPPLALPGSDADKIVKAIAGHDGRVAVAASASRVALSTPERTLRITQLETEMIDYSRLQVPSGPCRVVIDTAELIAAIQRCRTVIDELSFGLRVTVADDGLDLSIRSKDGQISADDHVHGASDGEPGETGVNPIYLLDALAHVPTEVAELAFAHHGPIRITGQGRDDVLHMVMQMRF